LALGVALSAALAKLGSFDLFFNISSGRWIMAHGFPESDPFSLTAIGSWFPHEWAFGVLAAESVQLLGGAGPALLSALVVSASVVLSWRLIVSAYGRDGLVPFVLFLLVLGAQSYFWQAQRAYLFGYFFFCLALLLATRFVRGGKFVIWLFVPLCALWANFHGSWLVGPVLLGAFWLGRLIDRRSFDKPALVLAVVAVASFLSAAISPRGFKTCLYPLSFLAHSSGDLIWEWNSLDLSDWSGISMLALMLFIVFALGKSKSFHWSLGIPAVGLTAAAFSAGRHAPMAALMLAVAGADLFTQPDQASKSQGQMIGALYSALKKVDRGLLAWGRIAGGYIWPFVALLAFGLLAFLKPVPLEARIDSRLIPVQAIKHMCDLEPGKVLNRYFLGGAISALCGPEFKVFIDGRNDLFPRQVRADYRKLVSLEPGWAEIIERYNPRYLLWSRMNYGSALVAALRLQGGWRSLLEEKAGMLWVKDSDSPAGEKRMEQE